MEEKLLLYSLLLTSIFNLIVLLVLALAIVRMGSVMHKLSLRVNDFLDKGEKEMHAVGDALKGTLLKSDQYVNAAVKISERYMAYRALNKLASSPKKSKILLMTLGIGYGLISTIGRENKSKKN
jgi:hypothetical protein